MKGIVNLVVEIPAGSRNKYEYCSQAGIMELDRILHSSVRYPFDYGFVPNTLADDGAPLDAMVIMDEPTAALGVKESRRVLELISEVRARGIPIILISHNMPHVFEVADRIHVHRLGTRLCVIDPKKYEMSDAVAFMTGAKEPPQS